MTSPQAHTFAGLLRGLREAQGLTQEELAERAAMSVRGLRYLEQGGRLPYPSTVRRLVESLVLNPEQRGQLEGAARAGPAAPVVLDTAPRTLPVPATPLIGRAAELAATETLLRRQDVRLLTLTGVGGVGKTRLALELAARVQGGFTDGARLIGLDTVSETSLVRPAIAQALGIREAGGRLALTSVIAALREQNLLLVLDNFEHLLAAAPLVAELLGACPRLCILVTSRAPLRLRAEQEFHVEPLEAPDETVLDTLSWDQVLAIPAVELFVQCARMARTDFALQPGDARTVTAICRRLDGLPLAIELAAARTRILTLPALLARLDRGLPLLTGGSPDLPERQQTLRRALAWSHALLHVGEQALFRRLAVFAGGCTLDAVETVCVGITSDGAARSVALQGDPLDWLESLVTKNLLVQGSGPSLAEPRFTMLETVREYGLELLEASEEVRLVRGRHLDWCVILAEEAESGLQTPEQTAWVGRIQEELANLRSAMQWAAAPGAPDARAHSGLRVAIALWRFWQMRGQLSEGRAWITGFDTRQGIDASLRARAGSAVGNLALLQGDLPGAVALLEPALALWRTLGDPRGIAGSLNSLGQVALFQGDPDRALLLLQEGLTLQRELGDPRAIASMLTNLGNLAHSRGHYARAREAHEESLALIRPLNLPHMLAAALTNRGLVAFALGDYPTATGCYEESLRLSRLLGDLRTSAVTLNNLGAVAEKEGDYARARIPYEESLALKRQSGDQKGIAATLSNLGKIALLEGRYAEAADYYRESLGLAMLAGDQPQMAAFLEELARIAAAQGRPHRAAGLFGAAEALREATGTPLPPNERSAYETAVAGVHAALGEAVRTHYWRAGRVLPLDQVVAIAQGQETAPLDPEQHTLL